MTKDTPDASIRGNPTIELAKELIRFKTTQDNLSEIKRCVDFVEEYLSHPHLLIRRHERNGKHSLIATFSQTKNPAVFFCGHLDVVPAMNDDQFIPQEHDGILVGRGAADMKTACAAYITLFKDLAEQGKNLPIGLMLVTDEEIGGTDGAKYLLEQGYSCSFFITGELSDLRVGYEAKGLLALEVTAAGKDAHSAKPWEGTNAIDLMRGSLGRILSLFPKPDPHMYQTTCIVSQIIGGMAMNSVPGQCRATLNIRFIPGDEPPQILAAISRSCPSLHIQTALLEPASSCPPDNPYFKTLVRISQSEPCRMHEASDARCFSDKGIPSVVFGLKGTGMHGADESVDMKSVEDYERILRSFLKECFEK